MKLIFGILASSNENYIEFKNVLIDHITHFKRSHLGDLIDFYFLYSEKMPEISQEELYKRANPRIYYDFYAPFDESDSLMASFVRRTFSFLNYIANSPFDYFIRTNITSLFDFNKFIAWLTPLPREKFFTGTLVNDTSVSISFSGTNLTMTKDLTHFLIQNESELLREAVEIGDDIAISHLITDKLYDSISLISMKRLDFVELTHMDLGRIILYQKCELFDESIFCFRFKTLDRLFDIDLMRRLSRIIQTESYNLTNFIFSVNLQCHCENPHLKWLSEKTFTLKRINNTQ